MTITSVLVHVEPGEAAASRLACAVTVADLYGAVLCGVGAEPVAAVAMADPYGTMAMDWQSLARAQSEARLEAAGDCFATLAGARSRDWRASLQRPVDALLQAARAADLIVAGSAADNGADTAELVLRAGRPVLVVPPTGGAFRSNRILVAWKDAREARRAVADAIPFLALAEAVVVMEACPDGERAAAEERTTDVVNHLRRHGIMASATVEAAGDARACTELHIQAEAMRADLIVAGCYGHGRLQEWVFGGVTRGLLLHPERYVLLSH